MFVVDDGILFYLINCLTSVMFGLKSIEDTSTASSKEILTIPVSDCFLSLVELFFNVRLGEFPPPY